MTDILNRWKSLGGILTSDPAAILNEPGGLVVFARGTDNAIWHTWQDRINGDWHPWESLGGNWTSGPAAALYRDGRLNVFARGADNAIWTRWQTTPNGDWSGWGSIGGVLTSDPAATLNEPGGLVVFARGTDNAIWHTWQDRINGDWHPWESLDGNLTGGPAAALYRDGRLNVFARGTDNAIWTRWQTTPNGDWSGWESIGGVLTSDPAATLNEPGGLVVFARGTDNVIWHTWQDRINGDWHSWEPLGGNWTSGPAAALYRDGRLNVFARGTDNAIWTRWQTTPNGHWLGPAGIRACSTDPWKNWAGNRQTNPEGHCYPTSLEELVAIVLTATQQGKRARAVGSSWSFSDIAVTPGYMVETSKLSNILNTVLPGALVDNIAPEHLIHVEAGIQLEYLMTILDATKQAPYTMGGAAGQTLAGVLSTSVHGSHFRLPPFPDWVRAIHLVGPDGMQHWIEPKDRPITDQVKLQAALGPDVQIHYDDDWFDAALVTVGGLGIIYSVVFEVREQYKLRETITAMKWRQLREQLADGRWFATADDAVQVAIDPGSMGGSDPDCYLSKRITVPISTPSSASSSFDPLAAFCEHDQLIELLFLAAKELGKPKIIVSALAIVLPSIPAVVAVAALFPPVLVALSLAAVIGATTAAAIPGLVPLLKAAGPGAVGDVVGAVLDRHPELTAYIVRELTKTFQPLGERTNIAHQIMAPRNKGECATRGLALEIAFDTAEQSHIAFIDAALAMLKEEAAMGRVLSGYFALRFVGRSRAILSSYRSAMTCTVEVVGLRTVRSTKVLLSRIETLGRSFGGIQHWGMFDDLKYEDVARSYPRLDTWLRVRNQLTSNGAIRTFDNDFMDRCGLIPTAKPKILLRNPNDGAIYVIYGGAKFHVPDPATLNRLFAGVPVRDAQPGELEHVGKVPGDGTLLHEETTGKVFVIYGGAKFHVPNMDVFNQLFPGAVIRQLWGGALDGTPSVPQDGTLLSAGSQGIFGIYGGAKFHMPNVVFNQLFPGAMVRQLWEGALDGIPTVLQDATPFLDLLLLS